MADDFGGTNHWRFSEKRDVLRMTKYRLRKLLRDFLGDISLRCSQVSFFHLLAVTLGALRVGKFWLTLGILF
ncbi:hypothetical protein BZY94_06340 [Burkholderia territorii]|nr:hypothetical protein BZY94_06340 [Burkholderia territorii]